MWRMTLAAIGILGAVGFADAPATAPATRPDAAAIYAEFGPPAVEGANKAQRITLLARVKMEDGAELPADLRVWAMAIERFNSTTSVAVPKKEGNLFEAVDAPFGSVTFYAESKESAPSTAGPFTTQPGGKIECEIVVKKGFAAVIRVVTPENKPVAGAKISLTQFGWNNRVQIADAGGAAKYEHAGEWPALVHVSADGFQSKYFREMKLSRERETVLTVLPAKVTTGKVLQWDGSPAAGAGLYLQHYDFPGGNGANGIAQLTPEATTNEQGNFELRNLNDDGTYYFRMATKDARGNLMAVRAGQRDLVCKLEEPTSVRGEVFGAIDTLRKVGGKPTIFFNTNPSRGLFGMMSGDSGDIVVDGDGERGTFFIPSVWRGGELSIQAGGARVNTTPKKSLVDFGIEVPARKEKMSRDGRKEREVEVTLTSDDGKNAAGAIRYTRHFENGSAMEQWVYGSVEVKEGKAKFKAYAGDQIELRSNLVATHFAFDTTWKIADVDAPEKVERKLVPAAAIYGQLLDAEGKPATRARVRMEPVENGPKPFRLQQVEVDAMTGKFLTPPMPPGMYAIVITGENRPTAVAEVVTVAAGDLKRVDAKFSKPRNMEGVVLGIDGKPMAGVEIMATCSWQGAVGNKLKFDLWPRAYSGLDGKFRIENAAPEMETELTAVPGKNWCAAHLKIAANAADAPLKILLNKGREMSGKIVLDTTGEPAAGVRITAMTRDPGKYQSHISPDAVTNEKGEFHFANLEDCGYELESIHAGALLGSRQLKADGSSPTLRLRPYSSEAP